MKKNAYTALFGKAVRFGLVTAMAFCISVGGTAFLKEIIGLTPKTAYLIALITVFCFNFLMCRYFIFAGKDGDMRAQLAVFGASSLTFRGAEYAAFYFLYDILALPYLLLIIAIQGTSALTKFFWYNVVFSARRTAVGPNSNSDQM